MFGSQRTRKGARGARAFLFARLERLRFAFRGWTWRHGFAPLAVYSPSCVVRRDPRQLGHKITSKIYHVL